MNRSCLTLLALLTIALHPGALFASPELVLGRHDIVYSLNGIAEIAIDSTGQRDINDMTKGTGARLFRRIDLQNLVRRATTEDLWIRFTIRTEPSAHREWVLRLDERWSSLVELYTPDGRGGYTVRRAGAAIPYEERDIKTLWFAFHLPDSVPTATTLLVHLRPGARFQSTPAVMSYMQNANNAHDYNFVWGLFYGILLVMGLYNLFIAFYLRDQSHFWFAAYSMSFAFVRLSIHQFGFELFWPNSPQWNLAADQIFLALSMACGMRFAQTFLDTHTRSRRLHYALWVFIAAWSVVTAAGLFGTNLRPLQSVLDLSAAVTIALGLCAAVMIRRQGYRPATYVIVGWSVFMLAGVHAVLYRLDVLPWFTIKLLAGVGIDPLAMSSAVEVVVLSLGLAYRVNLLREEITEKTLERERIAKQREIERRALIEKQKEDLEHQVTERTAELREKTGELEATNVQLGTALESLRATQLQLIHSEKMSSLGQLTAGIAHEINNPINFVSSNVKPLQRDLDDVVKVLNRYRSLRNAPDRDKALAEIRALKDELDIPYVVDEIGKLVLGIEDGARRTADIVHGLQNFTQSDVKEVSLFDVHAGIDSTLIILHNLYKDRIEIVREYGEIPEIECYPGQINQVFMNILSNAIQAIQGSGVITIATDLLDDRVRIRLSDTGAGMSDEVRSKVFDPFFTTKDVGSGTGLGMSISLGIITSHNGTIDVESELGKGTTFTVILPCSSEREA